MARLQCRAAQAAAPPPHEVQSSATESEQSDASDWEDFDWDTYDWRQHVKEQRGPAFESALQSLEWSIVCEHIAAFAATMAGKNACRDLEVGSTLERTLTLQRETQAVEVLEQKCSAFLDFGGVSSTAAGTALQRANKGGLLNGIELRALAQLCDGGGRLQGTLRGAQSLVRGTQNEDAVHMIAEPALRASIPSHLVKDIQGNVLEHGKIADKASDDLRQARQRVAAVEGRLNSLLQRSGGEVKTYKGRFCVAQTRSGEGKDRGGGGAAVGGIVIGSSAGGGTEYLEPPAAVPLNNDLIEARAVMDAAEERVRRRFSDVVVEHVAELQALLATVAWLDTSVARHRYTEWIGGLHPTFEPLPWKRNSRGSGGGGAQGEQAHWVQLRELRHPLLQGWYLRAHAQSRRAQARSVGGSKSKSTKRTGRGRDPDALEKVVPVDILVPEATRCVVITGPNTGGKTAALKALGLAVLLANAGCGVPCGAPPVLPHFSAVLADIGDEQSLSGSLSTFSGHLARIQAARKEADGGCLMLLDEVGTGTDPVEGTALGAALLERLAAGGRGGAALTMATTHMSALTSLKYEREDGAFENASAEFDEATLQPTYRLLWGVPGRSNALNIAARLGMPQRVVDSARELMGATQVANDSTIMQLEAAGKTIEELKAEARAFESQKLPIQRQVADINAKALELEHTAPLLRPRALRVPLKKLIEALKAVADAEVEERKEREADERRRKLSAARRAREDVARSEQEAQEKALYDAKQAELKAHEDAVLQEQREKKERAEARAKAERERWRPARGDSVYVTTRSNRLATVNSTSGKMANITVGGETVKCKLKELKPAEKQNTEAAQESEADKRRRKQEAKLKAPEDPLLKLRREKRLKEEQAAAEEARAFKRSVERKAQAEAMAKQRQAEEDAMWEQRRAQRKQEELEAKRKAEEDAMWRQRREQLEKEQGVQKGGAGSQRNVTVSS